jgi:outer membrane lipase/esterase
MKSLRSWALVSVAAALLAACGGGDPRVPGSGSPSGAPTSKGVFTSVVSFGTSASDLGTYAPATSLTGNGQPPFFGGKFSTNSDTATVWVQNLAGALGVIITPAQLGFNGTSVQCPAAANPALANTCTGYGQGGSMVTNPNGIGKNPATGAGALTVPIVTQIDNHLARFTSFKASDLIVVEGGLNDLFVAFEIFATKAQQIQAQAASGAITPAQANSLLFAAQIEGQGTMKQAALELAGYVRGKILANGGKYVAVAQMPSLATSPFGQSLPASARGVLVDLTATFNLWLREGLTDQPVAVIGIEAFQAVADNPAGLGFTNVTDMACDAAKISALTGGLVTDGNPVFCNSTPGAPFNTLVTGADPLTWFYADDVHPTTGGHKLISDLVTQQLTRLGWI